jgi:hypothetical protein
VVEQLRFFDRTNRSCTGGFIHHSNPLFGHMDAIGSTYFSLGGLPAWINSGAWNLRWVADRASHVALHTRLHIEEEVWSTFIVNPRYTITRGALDVANACSCQ